MTGNPTSAAVRAGYDSEAGAALWTEGPARHYVELAQVLVAAAPVPLAGLRLLDVGAGNPLPYPATDRLVPGWT